MSKYQIPDTIQERELMRDKEGRQFALPLFDTSDAKGHLKNFGFLLSSELHSHGISTSAIEEAVSSGEISYIHCPRSDPLVALYVSNNLNGIEYLMSISDKISQIRRENKKSNKKTYLSNFLGIVGSREEVIAGLIYSSSNRHLSQWDPCEDIRASFNESQGF